MYDRYKLPAPTPKKKGALWQGVLKRYVIFYLLLFSKKSFLIKLLIASHNSPELNPPINWKDSIQ